MESDTETLAHGGYWSRRGPGRLSSRRRRRPVPGESHGANSPAAGQKTVVAFGLLRAEDLEGPYFLYAIADAGRVSRESPGACGVHRGHRLHTRNFADIKVSTPTGRRCHQQTSTGKAPA